MTDQGPSIRVIVYTVLISLGRQGEAKGAGLKVIDRTEQPVPFPESQGLQRARGNVLRTLKGVKQPQTRLFFFQSLVMYPLKAKTRRDNVDLGIRERPYGANRPALSPDDPLSPAHVRFGEAICQKHI